MTYDPFTRGPLPVGVRSDTWQDADRDRTLPVEVWYPAAVRYAGWDLQPERQDAFAPAWTAGTDDDADLVRQAAVRDADQARQLGPLVLMIHGWAGDRREATYLGTHLASHGYTVISPDVPGSTYGDVDALLTNTTAPGDPAILEAHRAGIADGRRGDIPFLIDTAAQRLGVDVENVGVTGASFGGYSSLIAPAVDHRIAATIPQCPAGGRFAPTDDPDEHALSARVDLEWKRDVPTLMLVADRDALLPLHSQLDLLRRVPATDKRLVVLARADHNHFVDDIDTGQEWLRDFTSRVARTFPDGPGDWALISRTVVAPEELCPGEHAHIAWRGLTTAHMDAHLRHNPHAKHWLEEDIDAALAAEGVTVSTIASTQLLQKPLQTAP